MPLSEDKDNVYNLTTGSAAKFTLASNAVRDLKLLAMLKSSVKNAPKDTAKVLANVLVGRAYAQASDSGNRAAVQRLIDRALAYNPDEVKAHLVLGKLAKDDRVDVVLLPLGDGMTLARRVK